MRQIAAGASQRGYANMTKSRIVFFLLVLGSGAAGCNPGWAQVVAQNSSAAQRAAAGGVDKVQLERRLESVGILIEKSSGAKQIESSGDARAQDRRARARELHKQATEAYKAGDLMRSSQLLTEASVTMFEAVRFAAPEKVVAEKSQKDFNARMESVKALLAAQKRVAAEKSNVKGAAEAARTVEQLIGEANQQAAAGRETEARATIDRAYLIAKASIASMRGGDTLVRSLNFATKEEEYRYELDRNDTHQMLIKVLLEEKRDQPELDRMVKSFLEKAGQMRGQAEASAARGDHVNGIKLLEDSTAELVKAIRNAGVYIPG